MLKSDVKHRIPDALFALLFSACLVFLLWKCRYGYAYMDEAFYLTVPYRLCRGDSLLLHEWHLSQLTGFLLFPAMRLYLALFGGTVRILLHFRILFTVVWGMAACFFYVRLRTFSPFGALLGALFFLLYAPFGIMALSYNSLGILLLLNACVIPATAVRRKALQHGLAGLFFAGAVLCCPYLILLYLLFTTNALYRTVRRRDRALLRIWLFFSLGSALLLVLFCLTVLVRVSPARLLQVLPRLFDDPEHEHHSLLGRTRYYVESILRCNRLFLPGLIAAAGITFFARRSGKRGLGLVGICLICVLIQLAFLLEKPYLNHAMFPLSLIGLYGALVTDRPEVRLPFRAIWLPGAVYTYCIHLSSNQSFYAISSASAVMTVASALIAVGLLRELLETERRGLPRALVCGALALLMGVQFGSELTLRYRSVFWEPGMSAQTVLLEEGPESGLLVSPACRDLYLTHERDMDVLRADPRLQKVLFLSVNTHLYLSVERDMAAFSAWLSGVNEASVSRLDAYYALLPDKRPDGIYVEADYAELAQHYRAQGYSETRLPSGACLLVRDGL